MTPGTRGRGQPRAGFYTELDPHLIEVIKRVAADRGVLKWRVVEDALRAGLPLLPESEEEVMPQSA